MLLLKRSKIALIVWAMMAAFSTYCCMYAFRKPFAAGTFSGLSLWGLDYKTVLIIAQVLGYMASKFLGIKYISELPANWRIVALFVLIGTAELSLILFAITPYPYNFVWLFVNGLPLGMVFGVVFSFLEGRRFTEILSVGLGVSIIFSSGFVKSIGRYVLDNQWVSDWWMPATVGMLFVPVLLLSVFMLSKIPAPDTTDIAQRSPRKPMTTLDRKRLFNKYSISLVSIVAVYTLLTIFRDIRDNFAVEVWTAVGLGNQPQLLVQTEVIISVIVLVIIGLTTFITNNKQALVFNHAVILLGLLLLAVSTFLFQQQLISPIQWVVVSGLGLFLGYTIFQGFLFERMMAAFKEHGNVGFLMYLADAFGYLGGVIVLLWRSFYKTHISWLDFYCNLAYTVSILASVFTVVALLQNLRYLKR
jgi:Family of unknown function (DUF5690)